MASIDYVIIPYLIINQPRLLGFTHLLCCRGTLASVTVAVVYIYLLTYGSSLSSDEGGD
jgi:hypothetical protein